MIRWFRFRGFGSSRLLGRTWRRRWRRISFDDSNRIGKRMNRLETIKKWANYTWYINLKKTHNLIIRRIQWTRRIRRIEIDWFKFLVFFLVFLYFRRNNISLKNSYWIFQRMNRLKSRKNKNRVRIQRFLYFKLLLMSKIHLRFDN